MALVPLFTVALLVSAATSGETAVAGIGTMPLLPADVLITDVSKDEPLVVLVVELGTNGAGSEGWIGTVSASARLVELICAHKNIVTALAATTLRFLTI